MISFIIGTVADLYEDSVVLECGGIGYLLQVPVSLTEKLRIGETRKLHTYLQVREDSMHLFGFDSKDDLEMFRMLIGVTGIGPKGALGILSVITPDDLRFAILADDAKSIARAPGVGLKTAKKVILDLRDKLKLEDAVEIKERHSLQQEGAAGSFRDARDEAVQALTALGYSPGEAMKAVRQVEHAEELSTEALLKQALKHMALF